MADTIPELLGIIREEISLYRELVEHARQKTTLLVRGSVEPILESNKIEETVNSKLRNLEKEMARLCYDLGKTFRMPGQEFTLIKLADCLEQSTAMEIRSQASLFANIVKQLKSTNRRNMRLIDKSIHYSRGLLALISNVSASYMKTGLFESIPTVQPTFSQRV
jgi:hypothetical protein